MMLVILIPVNIFLLAAMLAGAFFIGFIFRRIQLSKLNRKIDELEKEMLANHAEILQLQKEKVTLEQQLKESSKSPVIPITTIAAEESKTDKLQDVVMRKKMMAKHSAADKHS